MEAPASWMTCSQCPQQRFQTSILHLKELPLGEVVFYSSRGIKAGLDVMRRGDPENIRIESYRHGGFRPFTSN